MGVFGLIPAPRRMLELQLVCMDLSVDVSSTGHGEELHAKHRCTHLGEVCGCRLTLHGDTVTRLRALCASAWKSGVSEVCPHRRLQHMQLQRSGSLLRAAPAVVTTVAKLSSAITK